jgi:hypothetical protein
MAFIQPCFIRKNTPELRKKLEELGYTPNSYECFWDDENRYIITTIDSNGFAFYTLCIKNCCVLENKEFIDCGDNEELFIALASMTDDEYGLCDYYIVTSDCNPRYAKGSIHRALPISSVIHPSCYRKATVEEIIEHFKKSKNEI